MDTELTVIEGLVCEDCYIKIERDGHKFKRIIIDLSEIEKMSQQLTTLQAEKEALEGELGRYRWIPVTEKKPEFNEVVLLALELDWRIARVERGWRFHPGLYTVKFDVTHWMPLPEFLPPTQEPTNGS